MLTNIRRPLIYFVLGSASFLLGVTSCSKQDESAPADPARSLRAYAPPSGRPELHEGSAVWFRSGDIVSMVSRDNQGDKIDAAHCFIDNFSTEESGSVVTFRGSFSSGQTDTVFAVHPYTDYSGYSTSQVFVSYRNDGTGTTRNNLFYVPFSPQQQAVAGDFPTDYTTMHQSAWGVGVKPPLNLAYAVLDKSDDSFRMHNACALLKFRLDGTDITSVDFRSDTNAIVAYRVMISFDQKTGSFIKTSPLSGQGNSRTVRVYPPQGSSTFAPGTTYYAAIAPISGSAPTVTLRKATKVASFTGPFPVTISAGDILPLGSAGLDTYVSEWTDIPAELTLTLDFTQGKGKPFTTNINTNSSKYSFTYTFSQGGADYTFKTTGKSGGAYYDTTNNYLVLKSTGSAGTFLELPAIDGRRLKSVTAKAGGFVTATPTTAGKFVCASNSGTSYTYGSNTVALESAYAGASVTRTSPLFVPGNPIWVGAQSAHTINLRELTLVYE